MSVLRNIPPGAKSGSGAIVLKCPKCLDNIKITGFTDNHPKRCAKCGYPLTRQSDLLLIVEACKKAASADQIGCAVRILDSLAGSVPEAGTALGFLAARHTLPISDPERWNRLTAAYAGGDENAREWLIRMCRSNPGMYREGFCKNCGAPKYYKKNEGEKVPCHYCGSME